MSGAYRLIVTDTSPLITLAVADELDVLLRAGLPVEVPDAVYLEGTRVRTAAGASRIAAWINQHAQAVRIVPTEVGIDQVRRIEEGRSTQGMGEQASVEVLDAFLAQSVEASALLLYEDGDVLRRRASLDVRVDLLSTGDFLRALEQARVIQSADRVLDQAALAGRNVERQRQAATGGQAVEALRRQLARET